jgi:SAM-dependent MidA family methyltransferase
VTRPYTPEPALPPPTAEALALSAQLSALIRAEIAAAGGALSFARYMELALYAPGLGYYSTGSHKFGARGDFITAPETSPLFARCLARQCQQVLAALGGGAILEFGAGSGVLAVELLLELERLNSLPTEYFILELSAELRARQQQLLAQRAAHLLDRAHWLDSLPVGGLHGVVLANEVLDAMPVQLFVHSAGALRERCIAWEEQGFVWRDVPAGAPLVQAVAALQAALPEPLPDGYCSEFNPALSGWVRSLAATLERGAALLIDYGYPRREYYLPERSAGTLMCHYRHRVHADPLILTGLQDITAHVDFSAVAAAGLAAGLAIAGYTTQAHFLLGSGLPELAAASDPENSAAHLAMTDQIKTLTLPGEMGERFKVLALTRGLEGLPLRGFALRDLRNRL